MKRVPMVVLLAVLLLGLGAGYLLAQVTADEATNTAAESESSADAEPSGASNDDGEPGLDRTPAGGLADDGSLYPAPAADVRAARATRLADGDSFDIEWSDDGRRDEVRLMGINAPEGDACFGQDARESLDALIADRELLIETVERDDFQRVVGNVWVDGVLVNIAIVEAGAALALSDGGTHGELIELAQEIAELDGAGLWSACGSSEASDLRIGWIEANAPGQDHLNKNGEWIEIVNDGGSLTDMSGWSIRDESTRHRYFFPDGFQLDAGAEVRVFSGCGTDTGDSLYWCDEDPVWNNGGDTGFLVDPDGRFASTLSY